MLSVHVAINPTWSCELSCDYCWRPWTKHDEQVPERPWQDWARGLINNLPPGATVDVSGGEPTLFPGLVELLGALSDAGIRSAITTNGLGMDVLADLAAHRPPLFVVANVSAHAQNPRWHDAVDLLRKASIMVNINKVGHPAADVVNEPHTVVTYQDWQGGMAVDGKRRECNAGLYHWVADPTGNAWRCMVQFQMGDAPIGNLIDGTLPKVAPVICAHGCSNCYTDHPEAWGITYKEEGVRRILRLHEGVLQIQQNGGGGAESSLKDESTASANRGDKIRWCGGNVAQDLTEFQPDVVHIGTIHNWYGIQAGLRALDSGVPVVWHLHDYWAFCLPEGQTVFRNGLPVPIEQIEMGDMVLASGHQAIVLQKFVRPYDGEIVSVKTQGLWDVQFTPEHPLLVVRHNGVARQRRTNAWRTYNRANGIATIEPEAITATPEWVAAGDVREGDYLCIRPMTEERSWAINLDQWAKSLGGGARRRYKPISVDEDIAYVLGWYLAEGYSSLNPRLCLGVNDAPYIAELTRIITEKCGIAVTRKDIPAISSILLYLSSRPLARMLRELFGSNAREKRIPMEVLRLPVPALRAFLRGYLQGDGSVSAHGSAERLRACFTTASRQLMQGLCLALFKVGIAPSVQFTKSATFTIRGKMYTNRGHYNIAVGGTQLEALGIDGHTTISKRRFEQVDGMFLVPIRQITRSAYSGNVYNLHTTNEMFDVPFVTHNCSPRMLLYPNSDRSCPAVDGLCDHSCGEYQDESYLGIVNRADAVVAGNEYTAAIMRRHGLRIDAVVESGVDTDAFSPSGEPLPDTVCTANAWGAPPTKGVQIIRKAVKAQSWNVDLITGRPRTEVPALLRRYGIFINASVYQETFCLCLLEGMAAGLACIAADVAGPRAQIEDGVTGLLYPPYDYMALRACVERLRGDGDLRNRLGRNARAHVLADHTLDAMGARWDAVYARVLSREKVMA